MRTPTLLLIALALCACSAPTFSSAQKAAAGSAGSGSYASSAGAGSYGSGGAAGAGGSVAAGGAPQADAGGKGGAPASGGAAGAGGVAGSGGLLDGGNTGPTVTCGDGTTCSNACYYSLGKYSCTRPLAQGVVELDCDATTCGAGSVCCIHFTEQLSTQSWYPTSADCQMASKCPPAPEHLPMCDPAKASACPSGWTCRKPFNSYAPAGYNMCWQ